MEIVFQSVELRTLCRSQDAAEEALSTDGARQLRTAIADMRAAGNVEEFSLLQASDEKDGDMTILLSENEKLIFRHSHLHPPIASGCIEWNKVYRVRILSIGRGDA